MTKVGSFWCIITFLLFSPKLGLGVGAQKSKVQSPTKLYIVFKVFIKEKEQHKFEITTLALTNMTIS